MGLRINQDSAPSPRPFFFSASKEKAEELMSILAERIVRYVMWLCMRVILSGFFAAGAL